ncbi:dihydroxy-acid dehydratase [Penicillium daleae]|uniref:Dihydroxy-acid dehydratase n=1 Tax=Penicillium daleae TaxID=63821 RepID=A0AAD6C528_9EURO|nr:dihydroxy-acid dehydratase [Penicillium daleae]KAJ5450407.1 dihydroxy-acid dehydratase [Penicillium daleae]
MMTDERPVNQDYYLEQPIVSATGMRQGLTSYGDAHFSLFLRKVFIKALGYSEDALSRPIIGIINTGSGFNPCHGNAHQLMDAAKRGIHLQGGIAIDFPTISLHEGFSHPTSMFLRNLMSMDTEEMIRAQPVDACIMIGGCDKTVPAQIMGGISANKPILPLLTGPMMPGSHRGKRIGACTDCRNNWASYRAGSIDMEEIMEMNEELAPTIGTCGVMGTASTMACITAALGLMPLQGASAPAVSAARLRIAEQTGQMAVAAAQHQKCPQRVLSVESFYNAAIVLQAIGGSTNAMVHLMAIVNRHPDIKGTITLKTLDQIGRTTPLLVDLKPSGDNYMTDFHNAGGMLCLLHRKSPFRDFEYSRTIIRTLDNPLYASSALIVVRGNIAPDGAVIKAAASKDKRLLYHKGPAVVFENPRDLALRLDDPNLDVSEESVLVLKGIGPIGNPGMPEAGMIPIPRKLAVRGVTDMLRISDGRMSGTAGGTIVLHVSPESAIPDSPFGVIQTGDIIEFNAERRILRLDVDSAELLARLAQRKLQIEGDGGSTWKDRETRRGYRGLYERTVNQAHEGADFAFLTATGS